MNLVQNKLIIVKPSRDKTKQLLSFFDLFTNFNCENIRKEISDVNSSTLVSAPKVLELDSDYLN